MRDTFLWTSVPNLPEIMDEYFPDVTKSSETIEALLKRLKIPLQITSGVYKGSVGMVRYGYHYGFALNFGMYPGTNKQIIRSVYKYAAVAPNTMVHLARKKAKFLDGTGRHLNVGELATYRNKICMVIDKSACGRAIISYMTRSGCKTDVVSPTAVIGIENLDTTALRSELTVKFLSS